MSTLTGQGLAVLTAVQHKGGFPVQRGSAPPLRGWGALGGQAAGSEDSEGRGSGSEGSGSKVENALSWHKCQHRFKGVGGEQVRRKGSKNENLPGLSPRGARKERAWPWEAGSRLVLDLEIQRHRGEGWAGADPALW